MIVFLRCRDVSELGHGYVDHDLPLPRWLGVRVHLLICSLCRAYILQIRRTRALLGRLGGRGAAAVAEQAAVDDVVARALRARDAEDDGQVR